MSLYALNPVNSHREELLEMVNYVNQATIGTPLTLATVNIGERSTYENYDVPGPVKTAVTLTNSKYPTDQRGITYNRLPLSAFMEMTVEAGDFNWYAPDEWVPETSPGQAVTAMKAAALRAGIDLEQQADSVTASRAFDEVKNRYVITYTVSSYVWEDTFEVTLPRHFSEEITVTDLNGLYFSPIPAESIVD